MGKRGNKNKKGQKSGATQDSFDPSQLAAEDRRNISRTNADDDAPSKPTETQSQSGNVVSNARTSSSGKANATFLTLGYYHSWHVENGGVPPSAEKESDSNENTASTENGAVVYASNCQFRRRKLENAGRNFQDKYERAASSGSEKEDGVGTAGGNSGSQSKGPGGKDAGSANQKKKAKKELEEQEKQWAAKKKKVKKDQGVTLRIFRIYE